MAAYLYLLEEKHDPSTIILAGDSAGGGMVMSMMKPKQTLPTYDHQIALGTMILAFLTSSDKCTIESDPKQHQRT